MRNNAAAAVATTTAAAAAVTLPLQAHAAAQRGVRTDELTATELVVTSAMSKMVASTITYPHEVVRSYMHVTGESLCRV